jgi:alpha-glucosidase
MIAPVLRPGKQAREVYLPEGIWFDTRSGERFTGPSHIVADAPLEANIPLYARGGTVIPSGPPLQWTDERPVETLTLDIYPDERGMAQGVLYEDDGHSMANERRERRWMRFAYQSDTRRLKMRVDGRFHSTLRKLQIRLHAPMIERQAGLPTNCDYLDIEV